MARNTKATPVLEAEEVIEADTEETTFSAKQVATELNIDAKSFRRWLRAHTTDRANKGGRWLFTADEKAELLEAYRRTPAEATDDLEVDEVI